MADLPTDRLEPAPPFTHCGVDVFGPWTIKEGRKEIKRWGVLYTCLGMRAIHVETLNSMSTDSFINSLRRLIAVRGAVQLIRCDNGTNFVGAKNELEQAWSEMDFDQIRKYLLKEECDLDFRMNVPRASHHGGVWERQIRSVRNVLAGMLLHEGTQLDDESLRTLLYEVMAIVNGRPLTTDNLYDPTSLQPLVPNQLLTMKSRVIIPPPGTFPREDLLLKKRWRRVQHLANRFWCQWRKEYVNNLQERPKWNQDVRNLKVGDIVIMKDDELPRNLWRLCRVAAVVVDEDGHVRKVRLAVGDRALDKNGKRIQATTYFERPVQKVVLICEGD
ncbi:uncharacterized protein LOC135496518 [Lineus longissimus]|uniref:uncharacterized protein LOC135496518 n=1 Tax=Lineus longissimus TaxID=88925 RepID=UPI00315D259E